MTFAPSGCESQVMALEPSGDDRRHARRVHREFAARPFSQYIPSERSLSWLSAVLRVHRPRRVLEFGGGIGTITAALLAHRCGVERVVTTEDDARFQAILRREDDPRHMLVATPGELAALDYEADLVVLDGGFATPLAIRLRRPRCATAPSCSSTATASSSAEPSSETSPKGISASA
jgi:hypothetical protein